jgi:hypothetical protein
MLHRRNFKSVTWLALAAVMLSGCSGDKTAEKIAKDKNLSPIEVKAFESCLNTSKAKQLFILNGKKRIMFTKPPPEFCACQAPVMAKVLTEEGFKENDKVLSAFAPTPVKEEIDPAGVKPDVMAAEAQSKLRGSVKPCIIKAKAEITKRRELEDANKKKKKTT